MLNIVPRVFGIFSQTPITTPDPQYLKGDQYKDASKLAARARLHSRYSRNPQGWFQWMFKLYDRIPPTARILELGAGAGWLWANNGARIPAGWDIILSDFSSGMLDERLGFVHAGTGVL